MDNLLEINKSLETHDLLRLNQEDIENMKRPITNNEIVSVTKNLPRTKVQDQMASR